MYTELKPLRCVVVDRQSDTRQKVLTAVTWIYGLNIMALWASDTLKPELLSQFIFDCGVRDV